MPKKKFLIWCTLKRHLGRNSLQTTIIRYDCLFRWLVKRKLTAKNVEGFVLSLRQKGLRNASINSYIRVVHLLDIYHREQGKDLNLLRHVSYFPKQKRVPTILSIEEIEALLTVDLTYARRNGATPDQTDRLNETYKFAIWTLAATGARYEEVMTLKKENLHLGIIEGFIDILDPKNAEDRRVPLPPVLIMRLKDFTTALRPNQYVYTTTSGSPIPQQNFNPDLRRRAALAGLSDKHVHAHCFRNSYIMEHLRRGTDPLTIAKLVGHRDVNSTLGYTKYDYDDILHGAENHPMFSRSLTPEKIIEKIADSIGKWPTRHDPRFATRVEKRDNSLLVEVYVK